MTGRRVYHFGPFTLDPTAKVLMRDGTPVRLGRKAVETLAVLVENSGQVVPKEEILHRVWGDRVVEEANVAQNIALIRKALGTSKEGHSYIQTIAGRGYRFLGPVSVEEQAVQLTQARALRRWKPWVAWLGLLALALAGLFSLTGIWKRRNLPAAFHVLPLTRLPGQELEPALSPDGQRVAFLWQRDPHQSPQLWLVEPGKEPVPLASGPGHYCSPAWSPNGDALAFLRIDKEATEVLVLSLANRAQRVVARFAVPRYGFPRRLLDWSPDGRFLAVSHPHGAPQPLKLHLVEVDTGHTQTLTDPAGSIGGDVAPRFSPDGRRLAFIRAVNRDSQDVYIQELATGTLQRVTRDERQISDINWLPDGNGLVIASNRGGEFRLWKLTFGGPGSGPQLAPTGVYGTFPLQLSLARRRPLLVYSAFQYDRNIWQLNLENHQWIQVVASTADDASPQYSPTGDRICFRSDRSGAPQLWVADADGSHPVAITPTSIQPSVGRWAPDGKSIVFNDASSGEIFLASESGPGQWAVRSLGLRGYHPVFSPDGAWIFAGTGSALVRYPARGGPAQPIVQGTALSLGISPDGQYVYFIREPAGTTLWRVPAAGGSPEPFLEGLIPDCGSCWAVGRRGIYFLTTEGPSFESQVLAFQDLATGKRKVLLRYPEPLPPLGSGPFSLSPDERALLCVRVDLSNTDILRVEPFP